MHAYSALASSPLSLSEGEPGLRGPAARAVRASTGARWMTIPTYVGTSQARPSPAGMAVCSVRVLSRFGARGCRTRLRGDSTGWPGQVALASCMHWPSAVYGVCVRRFPIVDCRFEFRASKLINSKSNSIFEPRN